jgi:hypothetical protein
MGLRGMSWGICLFVSCLGAARVRKINQIREVKLYLHHLQSRAAEEVSSNSFTLLLLMQQYQLKYRLILQGYCQGFLR